MGGDDPAGAAVEQLKGLATLGDIMDRHGLDYWLFGGWAVDFWLGKVTRAHDDVDLAVWRNDYEVIRRVLALAGWRYAPVDNEAIGASFRSGAVLAELTFVVSDDSRMMFIPFPDQPVLWSAVPFGSDRRELRGVSCRTIPLAVLKAGKSVPRADPADAAKDRADFEALTERYRERPPGP